MNSNTLGEIRLLAAAIAVSAALLNPSCAFAYSEASSQASSESQSSVFYGGPGYYGPGYFSSGYVGFGYDSPGLFAGEEFYSPYANFTPGFAPYGGSTGYDSDYDINSPYPAQAGPYAGSSGMRNYGTGKRHSYSAVYPAARVTAPSRRSVQRPQMLRTNDGKPFGVVY